MGTAERLAVALLSVGWMTSPNARLTGLGAIPAYGKFRLLDGDPSTGKTLLICAIAAARSRGFPLPDQSGKLTTAYGRTGTVPVRRNGR